MDKNLIQSWQATQLSTYLLYRTENTCSRLPLRFISLIASTLCPRGASRSTDHHANIIEQRWQCLDRQRFDPAIGPHDGMRRSRLDHVELSGIDVKCLVEVALQGAEDGQIFFVVIDLIGASMMIIIVCRFHLPVSAGRRPIGII